MADFKMIQVEDLTLEQLREEVAYWRQDAGARLWASRARAIAARKEGDEDRVAHECVATMFPTRAALQKALSGDYDDFHCEACGEAIRDGQRVFSEHDGGYLHADCMGEITSAEGFVDPDGEPLPADAPTPQPFVYDEGFKPARLLAELAAAEAFLNEDVPTSDLEREPA